MYQHEVHRSARICVVYNPITDDENFAKQSKTPGTKGICDDQPIAHPAPYSVVGQDGVFGVVAS